MSVAASAAPPRHPQRGLARALLVGIVLLGLLLVPAFWPLYLGQPWARINGYTHLHALSGLLWLLLALAQAALMWRGQLRSHRALGRLAYAIGPLFVVSSLLLAHDRFSQMDAATFAREAYTLYLPLSMALLFAAAWVLALVWRHDAPLHGRLMACTVLPLVDPVLGRTLGLHVIALPQFWHYQILTFGLVAALATALWITLPPASAQRRRFGAYAVPFMAALALWFVLPFTDAWLRFAVWFRGLPLT